MLYGSYKNARNAAWQCLLDFDIRELPVKPSTIAKQLGIKIIKNSSINELSEGESGATYLINSKWYIVYNDTEPRQRSRFTVAHELGHILLGHIMCDKHYARTFDTSRPTIEQEADVFAARLLAPACVLWALNVHTPQDISELCDISLAAAQVRSERMEILYSRNKFLQRPLEKAVYDNFKEYIQKQTAK